MLKGQADLIRQAKHECIEHVTQVSSVMALIIIIIILFFL